LTRWPRWIEDGTERARTLAPARASPDAANDPAGDVTDADDPLGTVVAGPALLTPLRPEPEHAAVATANAATTTQLASLRAITC